MPRSVRTIGQVMKTLKPDFPDLSISKIRFLESEGLLSPERAPSGYRKYSDSDVERLRYILTCQRDHFQPLRVIRDHLDMMDRGEEPPVSEAPPLPTENDDAADRQPEPTGPGIVRTRGPIRMNRRELIRASGITEAMLMELERHQLVRPKRGASYYGQEALVICVAARRLMAYGMDTRHMRAIRQAAEHEAGLIEQALIPHARHPDQASKIAAETTKVMMHAHTAMVYDMLEHWSGN
ncbi:MerR family transcriptional regulator [Cutibacterium sp. WCA-380-WT-3A]|uniref:MerR family transcriptional regulator n=1 Tax=Cutibacterium porci TaxID=2605781 RepID=A0A7K0J6I5_9ACTN|nr:MerR family transcriptional regulator [Cutibacterium porci]MSS45570.1 MerR family transcriptional regulator [Cutibacterium porci]